MGVKIFKDTKVFVACPANAATGGPELLHQLVDALRNKLGVDAYLYYYRYFKLLNRTPVHPAYQSYNLPYVLSIKKEEDNEKNILIVSEVLSGLSLLPKFKNIRKGVWFLSVDNYYYSKVKNPIFLFKKGVNKILAKLNLLPVFEPENDYKLDELKKIFKYQKDPFLKMADFYMVNSYYGMEWFKELKPMYYLSEYLNLEFLNTKVDFSKKQNLVAYNPKKGFSFTKAIIKSAKGINFIPLFNMTRDGIINTLLKSKVYIDFGTHPGKDRLPREAAICGCCVITGMRGSAGNFKDVPIPSEYKFDLKQENIPKIVEKIKDCLKNFDERQRDFEFYRETIKKEPQEFEHDLQKVFQKI
jgi:hypothetical protein